MNHIQPDTSWFQTSVIIRIYVFAKLAMLDSKPAVP
jgi:hypothetical protein